ncbi:hypothetical protein J3A83DRAFT_4371037 [Scleroderma citrinum]
MLSTRQTSALPLDSGRRNTTKTPGRALAKPRSVLQENACRDAPMTVNAKSRKVMQSTPLQLKTLQTDRVLKVAPGKQTQPSKPRGTPLTRPLGDKTPFPNRTANQGLILSATGSKIANPTLLDGALRTSSTRKHDRLPRSASKTFETPVTSGNHWDVSDIDIEVGGVVVNQSLQEEDYDEVEYMPPKVEDVPYEPPFELPDYREVGKTLMTLIRSFPLDEDPPSVPSFSKEALESKNVELPLPSIGTPASRHQYEILARPSNQSPESDDLFVDVKATTKGSTKAQTVPSPRKFPRRNGLRNPTVTKTAACTSRSTVSTSQKLSTTSTHRLAPTRQARPTQPNSRPPLARIPSSARATGVPSVLRSTEPLKPRSVAPSHASTTSTRTTSLTANKASVTRNAVGITKRAVTSQIQSKPGSISKPSPGSNPIQTTRRRNVVLETPKNLEGLVIFEDAWETEEFRFDV